MGVFVFGFLCVVRGVSHCPIQVRRGLRKYVSHLHIPELKKIMPNDPCLCGSNVEPVLVRAMAVYHGNIREENNLTGMLVCHYVGGVAFDRQYDYPRYWTLI